VRPSLRTALVLAAASALLLAPLPAQADNIEVTDSLNADLTAVNLGDICSGQSASVPVGFLLKRNGSGAQVWANNAQVTVSAAPVTVPAGTVSAGSRTVTTPANWVTSPNNTTVDVPDVTVSVAAATLAPGAPPVSNGVVLDFHAVGAGSTQPVVNRNDLVTVAWRTKHCDTTPPEISYVLSPSAPAAGGWFGQPVGIDWTVDDPESVETTTGCVDATRSTSTTAAGHTFSCSASSAGGTAGPVDVNVKVDLADPVVTPVLPAVDGANGWYVDDATLHWDVSDALSGLQDPDACPDVPLASELPETAYSCTVVDNAGRSASATVQVKRDATAPVVTTYTSGLVGDNGWYRGDVDVSWTVEETTSAPVDVIGCVAATVSDTTGVTLPCAATNDAGRTTSAPVTLKIDSLAPSVNGTATGQTGDNGWFTDDVTVTWETSDAGSGVVAGCADDHQTTETTGVTFSCTVADVAGNSAGDSVDVKLDKSAPTVDVDVSGTAGLAGWFVSDAVVDWTVGEDIATPVDETACVDVTVSDTDADGLEVSCSVVNDAGLVAEDAVTVKVDTLAPSVSGTASGQAGDNGWFTGDVVVAWETTDSGSGVVEGCDDDHQTTETSGTTLTCSVVDVAGHPASGWVDVKLDKTAPVIAKAVTGTEGLDGWFTSDADVDWTVTEDVSGPADLVGCADTTVSDSNGTTLSCSATNDAGLEASDSVPVKVDTIAPVVTGTPSGALGDDGWYVGDVTVTWSYTETGSGVTDPCAADTQSDDTVGETFTCTVHDAAGHTSAPGSVSVKKDATDPTISWLTGPADGATYDFGDPIPAATCSATDATSGVTPAGCTVTGGGSTVGAHSLTAAAADNAGNTAGSQRSYTVNAWTLDGFYRPVDLGGVLNTVKAGSTVPLKFNVLKGTTRLTADIGAVFSARKVSCESGVEDALEEFATTGRTELRYDATGGQWIQNWATPTAGKGSCYRVTMTTADGSSLAASFKLK